MEPKSDVVRDFRIVIADAQVGEFPGIRNHILDAMCAGRLTMADSRRLLIECTDAVERLRLARLRQEAEERLAALATADVVEPEEGTKDETDVVEI